MTDDQAVPHTHATDYAADTCPICFPDVQAVPETPMATDTPATAAYFAATADGPFDHQRDAYEAGYDAGCAEERERIIGSDRESLQLMLESIASLPNVGPDAEACGRVVRRLLDGQP